MNYIDLGLPSGILWADSNYQENKKEFFTFEEANNIKNAILPSTNEFQELIDTCLWERCDHNNGYKIIGPNGNHIFLPDTQHDDGFYWSSTIFNSDKSYCFSFNVCRLYMYWENTEYQFAVRTIEYPSDFKNLSTFESYIFKEVSRKWKEQFPEDMESCYSDKGTNISHKWYMRAINGRLNYDKIKDSVKNKKEMMENRITLYRSLLESQDIRLWCINNIII